MKTINIQSVSDLITNSSSEVYLCLDYNAVENFKEIVNTILKVGGSDKTCDELFAISEWGESLRIEAIDPENKEAANTLDLVNGLFYATD